MDEAFFKISKADRFTENVMRLLNKLKTEIQNNQLDLNMLFEQFDLNQNKTLELSEFTKMVKALYKNAKFEDINDAFNMMDKNDDNRLEMSEFENVIK